MFYLLFALLLFTHIAGKGDCMVLGWNDNTDLHSLLEFKQAITKDPTRALSSWNRSTNFCRWNGVTCSADRPKRHVMKLELAAQSLVGHISPSLGNLTYLVTINFSTNSFSGNLPPLFHRLQNLQILDLSNNLLHGVIPQGLANCSDLRKLDLYGNSLQGKIPEEIGLLSHLSILELSVNKLTGTIPAKLSNITSLEILHVTGNQLEGRIPHEFGRLSKMRQLLLGGNRLSGEIPVALFNLTLLRELDLDSNELGGTLPSDMGDTLPNLETLELGGNMIEGHVPASLGNASRLSTINMPVNNFTGHVPSSFGKLQKLYSLNLERNQLKANDDQSWEFLAALSNCSLLDMLSLYGNQLEGVLPDTVGNLSAGIQSLLLGTNNLSGMVPLSIGNLKNLTKFSLAYNGFTGTVEGWITNMKKLQGLNLHGNNFNGSIPFSIGNLTQLSVLYMDNNKFDGVIPSSLGNLRQLSDLDLSYNNLQGNIPKEILASGSMTNCILSYNNLEGVLPPEVGSLQQLTELQLSSNKLTGAIPKTLAQCKQLETIKMDQNFFTEDIPISLGDLQSLTTLNLSHNKLSGAIPTALGDLKILTQLDLSYNHLEGEIPTKGVFKNTTAISLNGNKELCGGVTDLQMPLCPIVSHKKGVPYYMVRVLVPVVGLALLVLLIYFAVFRNLSGRPHSSLPSFHSQFPKVSYKDLLQATSNFSESNLVGRGSCSFVYRGQLLPVNAEVAVKVFELEMQGADISFMSECEALRSTRHRNILPILSVCSTIDYKGNPFKAIVYEFMPNGDLETWLHPASDLEDPHYLGIIQRVNVAINIADALDYLHHDCERHIIHCDLKPSNILLDADMVAHLGDFSISRVCVQTSSQSSAGNYSSPVNSASVNGTIGYIAPEYAGGSHVSTSGDVYSYGVLLLEMLTGKSPTDPMFNNGLNIIYYVENNLPDNIFRVVDAYLQEESEALAPAYTEEQNAVYQCFLSLLKVAVSCALQDPSERISMREVSKKLNGVKMSLPFE